MMRMRARRGGRNVPFSHRRGVRRCTVNHGTAPSNTTRPHQVPGREGRSQKRLARVLLAVATSTLATSCGPVVSEPVAAGRPTEDGTRSAATRSRDTESVPSGAHTPFVYEPRYPRALTSTQEEGCRDDIVRARQDPSADWVVVLSHRSSYRRQIIALRHDERIRVECLLPDLVLAREVDAPIAGRAGAVPCGDPGPVG